MIYHSNHLAKVQTSNRHIIPGSYKWSFKSLKWLFLSLCAISFSSPSPAQESGIEILLKSKNFKILEVHGWQEWAARLCCHRGLEKLNRGCHRTKGTQNGQHCGIQGRSSGSRKGMGHAGWGHLAHEQGQLVWKHLTFSLVGGDEGDIVQGPLPQKVPFSDGNRIVIIFKTNQVR